MRDDIYMMRSEEQMATEVVEPTTSSCCCSSQQQQQPAIALVEAESSPHPPPPIIIDWTKCGFGGGKLVDFDDGHCPVNFRQCRNQVVENNIENDNNVSPPRLLLYEKYVNYNNNDNGIVVDDDDDANHHQTTTTTTTTSKRRAQAHVIDDAVSDENTVDILYDLTFKVGKPWGTYVTRQQIMDHLENNNNNNNNKKNIRQQEEEQQQQHRQERQEGEKKTEQQQQQQLLDEIAVEVAASFMQHAIDSSGNNQKVKTYTTTSNNNNNPEKEIDPSSSSSLWTLDDDYHGIAVWALPSDVGSSVPYHIDYAEQVRYETNVIVPPVLAGTLHCTPRMVSQLECECCESTSTSTSSNNSSTRMKGGDFGLYLDDNGFEHYHKHGYKCIREPLGSDNHADENNTVVIPYKYNRMIIQSGHLPHWSTKIEAIVPSEDDGVGAQQQRVICGFNVFGHDVGPFVQQYPEHSDAFRKRVVMLNHQQKQKQRNNNNNSKKKFDLQSIKTNPKIAQMLVLAKREKVKKVLAEGQNRLDKDIEAMLEEAGDSGGSDDRGITVKDLMRKLVGREKEWPRAVDVQVHIHHGWKQGKWDVYEIRKQQQHENQNDHHNNTDVTTTTTASGPDKQLVPLSWIVTNKPT